MNRDLQIAFIQDALPFWGGAEKVLATALEAFPQAEVYTLVYRKEAFRDTIIGRREIHTSFVDRLPAARQRHRVYLPLMPLAIEQFDLSRYDILVSFSYAVAHGILPRPGSFTSATCIPPCAIAGCEAIPQPDKILLRFR